MAFEPTHIDAYTSSKPAVRRIVATEVEFNETTGVIGA